ncbi:MAG: UDP-N-acetylmuramate--L-alanine ligase [Alphaproteobacteria bacterium]|nr:UDP-N-acetylmuramate--L-alanine ligase [Alphaproteobacteria bacterium]
MRVMPKDIGVLHFVGIGGIGMSGIAEVLHGLGYQVRGSDVADGYNTERLKKKNIPVMIGHDARHVDGAHIIVVSSAIKPDNPELLAARAQKIPVVRRAEMLAELMRLKWAVAIAGTHGKTTTTSMVGALLEEGGLDPTVINGGIVHKYGTNTRLGSGQWMVVEADESDGTFTKLPATVGIITNIDPEHMDHYGSFDEVKRAFFRFADNLPFYGFAVLCTDHPEVQALVGQLEGRRVVTYGFNPQADVRAFNIRPDQNGFKFDVSFADWMPHSPERQLRDVFLPMFGEHNVQNALAALAVAHEMGISGAHMISALSHFSGVKRRFTKTGMVGGVTFIDDYGHHPVEIRAVLKAARQAVSSSGGRVIAVMQPHRYTRLQALFDDFSTCFNDADTVLISDVYSAGEPALEGVSGEKLAAQVSARGHKDARYLSSSGALAPLMVDMAEPGDFVVCLGAGDITKWAYALPADISTLHDSQQKKSA